MRNLKRALSLAMASVMTLGMMTVGTSAKGIADFSDAAEITNVDAVAVTSAIGIFKGYDDGEFKGSNVVTRAEMAVICAKLLYGADVDPAQFKGAGKFTDTPAWAEGYINLCASLGIIAGRGNGIFDPSATVSTVEAASMLTKTLGYFKNAKDYGEDWKLAVTAKATNLGLYGDLKLAADAGLTRDSVAELVFNTLTKAVPVDYNELLGVYYNQNQGIVYALEFNYLQTLGYQNFDLVYKTQVDTVYGRPATTWGTGSYDHYADAESTKEGALDANGGLLSGYVRMLDRDEITTVADVADYEFTKNTKSSDIYKALGKNVCEEYEWEFYVDGKLNATAMRGYDANDDLRWYFKNADDKLIQKDPRPNAKDTERYNYTNKGAVTEIYVDKAEQKVTLCQINYYLGEVTSVKSDDDGEYANIKALSSMGGLKLDSKKFYTSELEAEDLVVFTVDNNEDEEYYIPEMFTPATATGKVSRVEDKNDSTKTYIRLDGDSSKYEYAATDYIVYDLDDAAKNNHPNLNEEYVLYMTPAGYVLGYELVDETVDQYLYVNDSDEEMKDWIAKVVLTDASTAKVDLNKIVKKAPEEFCNKDNSDGDELIEWKDADKAKDTNIDGKIFKYSVNDKGVYSLTYEKNAVYPNTKYQIETDEAYLDSYGKDHDVLTNSKTIFVDTVNDKAYVGHKNVPNVENAEIAYVLNSSNVAKVVFILSGNVYDKDATYFFLADTDRESLKYDGEYYYEYTEAYDANGEQFTLTVEYDAYDAGKDGYSDELEAGKIYKIKKTIDGIYATEVVDVEYDNSDFIKGNVYTAGEDTFRLKNATNYKGEAIGDLKDSLKFDTDKDTQIVLVEAEYKTNGDFKGYDVSKGDLDDMIKGIDDEGYTSTVYVVKADDQDAELVFIVNHPAPAGVAIALDKAGYVDANDVTVAGLNADGTADIGDELVVKMAINKVKAYQLVENGIYIVVINGAEYLGYAINGHVCVKVTVTPDMMTGTGIKLDIAEVYETKDTYDAKNNVVAEMNAIENAAPAQNVTVGVGNAKPDVYLTVSEVKTDSGYAYKVNNDAVVLTVAEGATVDTTKFTLDVEDLKYDQIYVTYVRFDGKNGGKDKEEMIPDDDAEIKFEA